MLKSNNTTPPRPKGRFFSNFRRSLRSNSQLSSLPESLFDPPSTLCNAPAEPLSLVDTNSPSLTSSTSSDPSSPSSSTLSRQISPPQRRHALSVTKMNFSPTEFLENRYIYSMNPEKLCLSHDVESDESLPPNDAVLSTPFFEIPAARPTDKRFYERPPVPKHHSSSSREPLRSALYEDSPDFADCLPEFMYDPTMDHFSSVLSLSSASGSSAPEHSERLSNQSTQSSASLDIYGDAYCSESYPSELGLDDSPTLGYQSEFPGHARNRSSSRVENWKCEQSQLSRSRIVDSANLLISTDFEFLGSILDTPPQIPQDTFADNLVGMAY
ncbi:hypothetical protein PCANC_12516 [Puccinia coronata f. sp. avenae]|uniref:Uncharacterized protein n=1 Tax=Puccinia coronata f. sp. avenae TaxID=200324 RepID=A0A2N5VG06_9BASI|nr:hypothetical protein PCANC_12516 [Puccinia coronata f. sp. avenae]PLW48928.1 hypothetical protein PCASD_02780 [Puccinia coronata f. sp. avenae]